MQVDRVIMALTANPDYVGFWNYVARVWQENFGLTPTLMFYGSRDEFKEFTSVGRPGDLFHVERVPEVTGGGGLEWACTWALFYGAAKFSDDVCLLAGVDQVPLNGRIFDSIKAAPLDHYVIGFADAYSPHGTDFPSSHHAALGAKFKEVFGIQEDWPAEARKVFETRHRYRLGPGFWGLDEAYSSEILRRRIAEKGDVTCIKTFHTQFQPSRLWRGKDKLSTFDFKGIAQGNYSEWHADRPFESNDPEALKKLKTCIPVYTW